MLGAEAPRHKPNGEYEPEPSIEAQILTRLGYGNFLDTPLAEASPIVGRHFLDAYGNSPHRQETEDMLYGFLDMPETDQDHEPSKDYEESKALITSFIQAYYGELKVD